MNTFELVKDFLEREGYRPEVDSDGDLHFKREGINFFFCRDDKDPNFFRIIMPNIYTLEDNREKVLEAINSVNRDMKVLKSFLLGDNLWLAIEMFIDSTPDLSDFFDRCLAILIEGRRHIAEEIFR